MMSVSKAFPFPRSADDPSRSSLPAGVARADLKVAAGPPASPQAPQAGGARVVLSDDGQILVDKSRKAV